MRRHCLLLLAAVLSLPVRAGTLADVEIYDRSRGVTLPVYRHDGRLYVPGEPRHEYEIRLRSQADTRLLAVTSVDGVNAVSGETAAPDQTGYVLDRNAALTVAGWRKSFERIAAFYFTALPDSYAARTGRPDDVGVIGLALFREKIECCQEPELSRDDASADAAQGSGSADASAKSAAPSARAEEKLGTGHGRAERSVVTSTTFKRASETPDEIITIFYGSRRELIAEGVIPAPHRSADRRPEPFPQRFVPDPS